MPWLVLGSLALAVASAKLVAPEFLSTRILSYPRLRAVASLSLIYGWLTQVAIAGILYVVPRVTGARIRSEGSTQAAGMGMNTVLALGIAVTLLSGVSGRDFLEMPAWLGIPFSLAMFGVTANVLRSLMVRAEPKLYSSLYYFVGALIWGPLALGLGTAIPAGGVRASVIHLFALNAYLYMFLGASAIGTALYLAPRVSGNPLYSHRLAVIGFWWLVITAPLAAQSRQILGPGPDWLETVSIACAIGLLFPVLTTVVNVFGTLHGGWGKAADNPSIKFLVGGVVVFAIAVLDGTVLSFRSVAAVFGATDWASGQVWLLVLGLSLLGASLITYAFPRLLGRSWYARAHVSAHFWTTVLAAAVIAFGAWASGLAQGLVLDTGGRAASPASPGDAFQLVLEAAKPWRGVFFAGALLFAVGQFVFGFNLLRSTAAGEPRPIEMVAPMEDE